MESIGLQKPEDLLLLFFNEKQQMSRDSVPITAESSSGDRRPWGRGFATLRRKMGPMFSAAVGVRLAAP